MAAPGRANARCGDTAARWAGVIARSAAFGCDAVAARLDPVLGPALAPIPSEHTTATPPAVRARHRRHIRSLLIAGLRSRDQHPYHRPRAPVNENQQPSDARADLGF